MTSVVMTTASQGSRCQPATAAITASTSTTPRPARARRDRAGSRRARGASSGPTPASRRSWRGWQDPPRQPSVPFGARSARLLSRHSAFAWSKIDSLIGARPFRVETKNRKVGCLERHLQVHRRV
jgi:hypothetical protein